MEQSRRRIHLKPRLAAAAAMLRDCKTAADIGCDHGRLGCALMQQYGVSHCIAADISAESLRKCERLASITTPPGSVETREGDGLAVLSRGEADRVAICGMGGNLIVRILQAAEVPLMGAELAVFAPMRGEAELRKYLYETGYCIKEDRVVSDAGRLYQVFSALPPDGTGKIQPLPDNWPDGLFSVGFAALNQREALLPALIEQKLSKLQRRLLTARGTPGEAALLLQKARLSAARALTEEGRI